MKQHGSCMVDAFLVTTEKCMNAGECDIVHQREREFHNTAMTYDMI